MLAKSGAEKMEVYHSIMVTGFTPSPIWISLGIGLIAVTYTVLSIRMIIRYLNHLKKTRSSIDPSFHRWLLFLSSTLLIPIVITVITRLVGATTLPFPVVVFALSLLIFIIYGTFLLQPKFFDKFQYQIDDQEIEEVNSIEKYQNSNLQNNQKSEYLEKIIKYMDSEKPYLDPELTILQFSNTVDIPTYYVSQIINEQLECNFIDFVNRYRIDEIKVKLEDPKLNHFKILNLAYDSGFNSKTAFYYAFKKHVDMTPGAYRKENQLSTA
ncbi:helix-turn-helix domain-containing protein [Portibacter lacus]|uniref:HTH araC/xylS-type domain-containing protein n=1 Tax=Portibacter lacus TaxID=1099794 RepID=A0AA37WGI9_9BACT|nr:helix-turn-helix domain-containing protein [Portibacter lacus]GLR19962.1 hypothetical protein GCM10007940_45780 [Portibacter lacus]